MNIEEAKRRIAKAKANNSTVLTLDSFYDKEKLYSEDLKKLLPLIKNLEGLTNLNLNENKIRDISVLAELTKLTKLNLANNQISDISILAKLKELTRLDLSRNKINDVSVLAKLTKLTKLNLSSNQISDVSVLAELKRLIILSLSSNQISDLSVLKELKNLTTKDSIYFLLNPTQNPPIEIVNQGLDEIWKYLEDSDKQGKDYVYETKVLIVGETETGKTTLFKKLLNPSYFPQEATKAQKKSTVGINIKTWEFPYVKEPKINVKANLWDFGGQEIQYTLHQYFLTKQSFYIFLISNRVGDNEKIHKADYWFKVISALGKDCPVLVILNERNDKSANTFDINKYIEQFGANLGEIKQFNVDFAVNDYKWNTLYEAIKSKISNLPHIGKETEEEKAKNLKRGLPKLWVEVRQRLEKCAENNNYITRQAYDNICKEVGIYEAPKVDNSKAILSQNLLLKFLHNLGVVINFEDSFLRNYLILNPHWLTKSLYMALEDKIIKDEQRGKFTSQYLQKFWEKNNYNIEEYNILLNLMLKDNFEIAYRVEGKKDDYVIPMLLPDVPLIYEFKKVNIITLIIRFKFMPYGVFSRLVVQLNNYIDIQNVNAVKKQIVWKKGMLLDSNRGSFAEVIESDDKEQTPKEIKIRVAGIDIIENKRFLSHIANKIYDINDKWFNNNLEFDELIPCICEVCKEMGKEEERKFYELDTLENLLREEEEKIICDKSAKKRNLQRVPIRKLLEGVYKEQRGRSGDTYIFEKETQFIKEAKDNVSIGQKNRWV